MATGTFQLYGLGMTAILNKLVDLDSNSNLYWMFTSSSHTPVIDTHDFEADLTNIVSGTNLSSAGIQVTSPAVTYDTGTNTAKFDATDISVATVTATGIRNIHLVDKTSGSSATNPLVAYATLDADLSPSAGTLAFTFDSAGIFTVAI
jgi:hypothetical protein